MNIVLRSSRPLDALAPGHSSGSVAQWIPALPIVQLRTMEDVVGASVTRQRFLSLLLGIFAAVAFLLAAIGTYGMLSYMVTERHREIGIRMALGAGNGQVVGLVLGQGLTIAAVGIVVGCCGRAGALAPDAVAAVRRVALPTRRRSRSWPPSSRWSRRPPASFRCVARRESIR